MVTFHIPTELIYQILAELEEDSEALRHCALTSLCFLTPAQSFLFRRIRFTTPYDIYADCQPDQPQRKLDIFANVISNSAHLVTHVKSLTLVLCCQNLSEVALMEAPGIKPTIIKLFAGIQSMTQIQYLSLEMQEFGYWDRLGASIQAALDSIFQLPSLQSITLVGVLGLPLPIYLRLLTKRRLALAFVPPSVPEPYSASCLLSAEVKLDSLFFCNGATRLSLIFSRLLKPPSTLRKLSISPLTNMDHFHETGVWEFMQVVSPQITHFEWRTQYPSSNPDPVDLSIFTSGMRHLKVTLRLLVNDLIGRPLLHPLIFISQLSKKPNVVETITVQCYTPAACARLAALMKWPEVCMALESWDAWPKLRRFGVKLVLGPGEIRGTSLKKMAAQARSSLLPLSTRGIDVWIDAQRGPSYREIQYHSDHWDEP